ncbi:MAG: Rrf2 family transcriptional regulator, partial [Betaproteobacteria bacterium]|nr:Rrf2 family transcriptional regulator [Betaproteobacteria bacterium]
MLFSRTSQYAAQALIYLATQRRDRFVLTREIAAHLDIPSDYLGKIMGTMSRASLLTSVRGRKGGYALNEGAENTDML